MTTTNKTVSQYQMIKAEIFYEQPDDPHMLGRVVWEDYDLAPDYPELTKFLEFWTENIDVPLHSVRVNNLALPRPPGMIYAAYSDSIH